MLRKFLISLWALLQFVTIINCQIITYKPLRRILHTTTLVDNKLYVLGGIQNSSETLGEFPGDSVTKSFFYLDVSRPFNTQNLPWNDLTNENIVPPHSNAASAVGGVNNKTLFLYGGFANLTMEVYAYDSQINQWSIPTIAGTNNVWKRNLIGISVNGKIYLWGGEPQSSGNNVNDMLILDTKNLNWSRGSLVNAPSPRFNYGAILLPDNNILYVGGFDDIKSAELALNQVFIYNTINDSWKSMTTSGQIPSNRDGFSFVLGLDGQSMIIFGGSTDINNSTSNLIPEDALYVLNLISYKWYIPNISGPAPNSRAYHKANVVRNYMVVSFGGGYDPLTDSHILLLDISNNDKYVWTNSFNLSPSPSSSPTLPSSSLVPTQLASENQFSKPAVIGAIIGSLVGGTLLSFGGYFIYKWIKSRQQKKNTILIAGNESHNY